MSAWSMVDAARMAGKRDGFGIRCALFCPNCQCVTHGRIPDAHPDMFHCSGCCKRSAL